MYNQLERAGSQAMDCEVSSKSLSIRKEIELTITHLEEHLQNKKDMLTLLDENPAIEKFMDLSRRS